MISSELMKEAERRNEIAAMSLMDHILGYWHPVRCSPISCIQQCAIEKHGKKFVRLYIILRDHVSGLPMAGDSYIRTWLRDNIKSFESLAFFSYGLFAVEDSTAFYFKIPEDQDQDDYVEKMVREFIPELNDAMKKFVAAVRSEMIKQLQECSDG